MKWIDFLRFIRPANIITAMADVFAGTAIVGVTLSYFVAPDFLGALLKLLIATSCLYAGGIIFNDVFDVEDDKKYRPERILPSGKLSVNGAIVLGSVFFGMAIVSAFLVAKISGVVAIIIICCALFYDKYAKHHVFLGPFFMGLCRGFNLLLGMTVFKALPPNNLLLIMLVPIVFIFAVTLTAQKENTGNNKTALKTALFLDTVIVFGFLLMALKLNFSLLNSLPFLICWYGINAFAKFKAIQNNQPKNIQKAIKTAILSLILLDTCYIAGFSDILYALIIICLLPISVLLSKKIAVT